MPDFGQGSGVTPDSVNAVLRSGLGRELPTTADWGTGAENQLPAEIAFCAQYIAVLKLRKD